MATTCCFCPTDRVNWDKPGGLCQCNWPCGSKDDSPFYNWYVDDSKETDVIIIPDKALYLPSWLLAMPPFWLHVCIMAPLMEANIFKVYEKNGNLTLDYLCKNSCSESIKYSCKKLVSASLDAEEEAGIFTSSRKLRISLLCNNGMPPDKGQWLIMDSQLDESVLQRCVDLINSKIARLNGKNVNTTFAQPVYGFSQQQPLAYGHMQPQVQVQPQVYYFDNSQPQPKLQNANDKDTFISNLAPQPLVYGNVQPQLQLQLQPQVHYFNNSQPQLQPQFANDNAAFISYSDPQPQLQKKKKNRQKSCPRRRRPFSSSQSPDLL